LMFISLMPPQCPSECLAHIGITPGRTPRVPG
jgi:hypothetical protein